MQKELYEMALEKLSHILHRNHHIMIDLEFTLVQLYGRQILSSNKNNPTACTNGETGSNETNKRQVKLCYRLVQLKRNFVFCR